MNNKRLNNKILLSIMFIGIALIQTTVMAAESKRSAEEIFKECGIGGVFFGKSSPIAAVISNVTWDLGTTALSSNVSSAETCVSPEARTVAFINNSYDSILIESAKGSGIYLQSLAKISGKSIDNIRSSVITLLIANNYATQTQQQKSINLYNAVM